MADVPVGAAPVAPAAPPASAAGAPAGSPTAVVRRPTAVVRADKLAAVNAGLAKLDGSAATEVATAATAADKPAGDSAHDPKLSQTPAAKDAAAPKDPAKPAADEPVDDKTAKGLAAIDRRAKAFRDEQAAEKAKLDLERVELARIKADVEGRGAGLDELRKLAKRDPIAALAKLGLESEDEWETVGRGAYPRTKAGKSDPRAAPAVAQTERERQLADELASLKKGHEELTASLRTRDAQAQQQAYVRDYLDSAVKAIPTTPTLIGKLHAKSPEKARQTLLELGTTMEREAMRADGTTRYDPAHTPSHAELITRYEKDRRAELEEQGVDVDALLVPAAAKPAPAPAAKPKVTLDPTSTTGTRPVNDKPTRAEKLAAVNLGLKKFEAEQN
jgi:hypothetical protein